MKSFIHSLSKLVWIKRGFFIRTSFDRLWMEIFPFLFLILKGFYKGFQMRYHLFFNSNGKAVKTIKMFFWKSAVCNQELVSVCNYVLRLCQCIDKLNHSGCNRPILVCGRQCVSTPNQWGRSYNKGQKICKQHKIKSVFFLLWKSAITTKNHDMNMRKGNFEQAVLMKKVWLLHNVKMARGGSQKNSGNSLHLHNYYNWSASVCPKTF